MRMSGSSTLLALGMVMGCHLEMVMAMVMALEMGCHSGARERHDGTGNCIIAMALEIWFCLDRDGQDDCDGVLYGL